MNSPRFTHVDDDDLEWQEVLRQRHGDRTVSVYEKWPEFNERYMTVYARWDPGMLVRPHAHYSDEITFVLEGEMTCGDVTCTPGTHIALDQADTFGPFEAGPDGVMTLQVKMGYPGSIPEDQAAWEEYLAERGVESLDPPPIDLPSWVDDTRG